MKKVAKKKVTKDPHAEEIKRYLGSLSEDFQDRLDGHAKQSERNMGALSEDFQHKVSAIGEQFGGLNTKVDSISKTLEHHGRKLDSHAAMIARVMEDVEEIKSGMREKIDRKEFTKLEKRLVVLETIVYGGRKK